MKLVAVVIAMMMIIIMMITTNHNAGVVVYFQKEGRGLGEVTKYRVYNARKAQEGGDCAEKYFYQTESIAGIRDARFQVQ